MSSCLLVFFLEKAGAGAGRGGWGTDVTYDLLVIYRQISTCQLKIPYIILSYFL